MNTKERMLEFIASERVGVVALGSTKGVHAATMHYSHREEPLQFIFNTDPQSRKCSKLLKEGALSASFVVGTTEDAGRTLQLDGTIKVIDASEVAEEYNIKFPEKVGKHPENIFLLFEPTWWRYTDWRTPEGKQILTSDEA